ncbi:MAG: hypothetical protein AB1757_11435 [Acidobacteriota bacterium]
MESKSKTKARLIIFSIFAIGFFAGALAMNLYERMTSNDESPGNHKPQEFIIKRMDQRMNLSKEQHTQIRAILDETFDQFKTLRKSMRENIKELKVYEGKFDEVRQKERERIREVLSSDQLPEFEKMIQEMEKRREEQRQEK